MFVPYTTKPPKNPKFPSHSLSLPIPSLPSSMSSKRSRNGCPSSFGDTGMPNHSAFGNGAKALKPSPEAEQHPPSVLTLPSPETVSMGREAPVDQFLDQCYFCRKRLRHNEDVFMCGPFRAFCSPECRDQQIHIDKVAEQQKKVPVQSTRTVCSMTNNGNGS